MHVNHLHFLLREKERTTSGRPLNNEALWAAMQSLLANSLEFFGKCMSFDFLLVYFEILWLTSCGKAEYSSVGRIWCKFERFTAQVALCTLAIFQVVGLRSFAIVDGEWGWNILGISKESCPRLIVAKAYIWFGVIPVCEKLYNWILK